MKIDPSKYDKYIISDKAVEWIEKTSTCFISWDFCGYIIRISKKVSAMVAINGQMVLFSTNPKKPALSLRRWEKEIKGLIRTGFLVNRDSLVFPEYANCFSLRNRVNKDKIVTVMDYFFG